MLNKKDRYFTTVKSTHNKISSKGRVLLTGVTGFLGSHTTIQLLEKDYKVIGTLRDMKRADQIRHVIAKQTDKIAHLTFEEADLTDKHIWHELTKGVDYVQHIASPFPRKIPKNENDLTIPARDGVLHVLEASSANKVKRVVITSSVASIIYGKEKSKREGLFNESQWTNPENKKDSTPYHRSKTIAEKAAWDFIKSDKSGLELSVVCPGAILGPVLERDFGTSANIVIKLMDGSSPALPDIGFDVVDVRSVADLQVRAMEHPRAVNERFIATSQYMKFKEIADVLRGAFPNKKIPKMVAPNFMIRIFANFDKTLKPILVDLGVTRKVDNTLARELLNWKPIPTSEAITSCAKSVIDLQLV